MIKRNASGSSENTSYGDQGNQLLTGNDAVGKSIYLTISSVEHGIFVRGPNQNTWISQQTLDALPPETTTPIDHGGPGLGQMLFSGQGNQLINGSGSRECGSA